MPVKVMAALAPRTSARRHRRVSITGFTRARLHRPASQQPQPSPLALRTQWRALTPLTASTAPSLTADLPSRCRLAALEALGGPHAGARISTKYHGRAAGDGWPRGARRTRRAAQGARCRRTRARRPVVRPGRAHRSQSLLAVERLDRPSAHSCTPGHSARRHQSRHSAAIRFLLR